ncbi:uncharacterized protein F5891DRAFT_1049015 [Suillus fuscotomentosus]|uniref:DUF6593 domain-containing protein n=1 Tax=Suillus fuscotomentosus TaxID=1912939 RepID=A0AAD4E080_9AGAM|nr:uncharacterized protein F5891DRAFT_1049015 [Suillus fuscotomentosus]KAG1897325.1 hypothetical protein F5891DRAFT_1049015 [Suillus fuscotomentosus]
MDSTTTLVNPTPPTPYFLTSTDSKNATFYAHPGIPLYTITDDGKQMIVNDRRTPGRIAAIFHQREILPNTISFPERNGNAPISVQKWLRKTRLADGTTAFVMGTDYGPYVWKIISSHRQKVYAQYDLDRPIASCSFHATVSNGKPAFLLEYDAEPLREDILLAYLLQRQRVISEDRLIDVFVGSSGADKTS